MKYVGSVLLYESPVLIAIEHDKREQWLAVYLEMEGKIKERKLNSIEKRGYKRSEAK